MYADNQDMIQLANLLLLKKKTVKLLQSRRKIFAVKNEADMQEPVSPRCFLRARANGLTPMINEVLQSFCHECSDEVAYSFTGFANARCRLTLTYICESVKLAKNVVGQESVDSTLKDMAAAMKQLDISEEVIEAINSFHHLCSHES
ncbi:hypothetical protein Tco_0891002 [Tanacetum coccineum]|uniref:Uncharacterized protein n=1 Tax=Tanacetum coccineum TaxID=301880 RepID=A0ABQ5C207_9ASTR